MSGRRIAGVKSKCWRKNFPDEGLIQRRKSSIDVRPLFDAGLHRLCRCLNGIGAGEMQAAAKRLEAAIRDDADTDALITELDGKLGELGDVLRSLTPASGAPGAALVAGETGDLPLQLDRLQDLLEDYDTAAGELVSEIESRTANTEYAERARAIGERIDDFEFDEALERLKELCELMKS